MKVLTALAVVALTASVHAQQQFSFYLSAANAEGTRVTDLQLDEISVNENGQPARIVRIQPISLPVQVTVMLDNSVGTGTLLVQYRNGLKGFFAALPTGVQASLLTLSPQPRWLVRPTSDRVQLTTAVDRVAPDSGASRFIDALVEYAQRVENDNKGKPAYYPVLVVMSTTGPEGSQPRDRDLERMVRQFRAHNARIHIVMLGTGGTSPNQILGARQVQVGKLLADETGGRYEAIAAQNRISSLLTEFGELVAKAHDFQSKQYLVTVERPAGATGELGQLQMGLARRGLTFTATPEGLMP
jgi:hypothetical protein